MSTPFPLSAEPKPGSVWRRFIAAAVVLAVWPPSAGAAEPDSGPVVFRRVYAPADQPELWPRDDVRYIPVAPEEFERLVRSARGPGERSDRESAVTAAEYSATFAGEELVEGHASLSIKSRDMSSSLFALEPCGLAIERAIWDGDPSRAASLGTMGDGKLAVVVERDGLLELDWSLRGKRGTRGEVVFPLELPPSPISRIEIELPAGLTAAVDKGIVTSRPEEGRPGRWQIELGSHNRVSLVVDAAAVDSAPRPAARVAENYQYNLTLHGLELSAELRFDVLEEPLERISLRLGPALRLATARYGGTSLSWVVSESDEKNGTSRVIIDLPEPIQGADRIFRLGAVAPLSMDRVWRLPRIEVDDVSWEEATTTLLVPDPLVVEQLRPIEARQRKTSPMPAPASGESIELQHFAPTSGVELVLGHPQAQVRVDSSAEIELRAGEVVGRVVADFHLRDGEQFELRGDVGRQWIIDAVECQPPEAMNDWDVYREEGAAGRLVIGLSKALAPERSVRITVSGRRLNSALRRAMPAGELIPVRFHATEEGQRLLSLATLAPFRLRLNGNEPLGRIDSRTVDGAVLAQFKTSPQNLFDVSAALAAGLRVGLERPGPLYSASVQVEATLGSGLLAESYRIRCIPAATTVDRLVVHFSFKRPDPLDWMLGGEQPETLTAQAVLPEEAGADSAAVGGETWEIRLATPRSTPFEIYARRSTPSTSVQPVSLISLPEATSADGRVIVSSIDPGRLEIRNVRLRSVPTEPPATGQTSRVRATFRYDPRLMPTAGAEAALAVGPADTAPATPFAWVWNARLESRYQIDGTERHLAVYRMQSAGQEGIAVALPPGVRIDEVQGVWVDRKRASWRSRRAEDGVREVLQVDLPGGRKYPVVAIDFGRSGPALASGRRLASLLPQIDVPVLSREWVVWLPPAYEAIRSADFGHVSRHAWHERLFGPLARSDAVSPLDPVDVRLAHDLFRGEAAGRQQALAELAALDRLVSEASRARATWGEMLASVPAATPSDLPGGGERSRFLVDEDGMAEAGLTPASPFRLNVADDHRELAAMLLRRHGLTLLVTEQAAVLTSATRALLEASELTAAADQLVFTVNPGPLADLVDRASRGGGEGGVIPAAVWARRSGVEHAPWVSASLGGFATGDNPGWRAYRVRFAEGEALSLTVVNSDTLRAFRWIVFLAVFAVLLCWPVPAHWLVVFAGLCGLSALVLPPAFSPIASGGLLAGLAAIGLAMLRRGPSPRKDRTANFSTPSSSAVRSATTAIMIACVGSAGSSAFAQGDSSAAAVSPPAARVFIPVDDDDQPTGEKYLVPESLYNRLHRLEANSASQPRGWLLEETTYRGSLAWQGTPERLELASLRVGFEVEVFDADTLVEIPLNRDEVNLLPDGATLDSQPIQPQWSLDGQRLQFEVDEPARYRLELAIAPTIESSPAGRGFSLKTPPVAASRLELTVPPDAPRIAVPSALGSVTWHPQLSQWAALLGPSDRLKVEWPEAAGRGAMGPAVDAEELLWLKVQPGSVVLDARLRLRVASGQVGDLRLTADPGLRLLPFAGENPPRVEESVGTDGWQRIHLTLDRPVSSQVTLDLSFLMTGVSGVGRIPVPRLDLDGARTVRRLLAVSLDPSLTLSPRPEGVEDVGVPQFTTAWGGGRPDPLAAFNLPAGAPVPSLGVRPRDARITATQMLALGFATEEALVHYEAHVIPQVGYRFQHRLALPAEVEVQSVSVIEQGEEKVDRWSRAGDGTVTIFLNAPAAAGQDLTVRGRLPLGGRTELPLPWATLLDADLESSVMAAYRQPAVNVAIGATSGLIEIETYVPEERLAYLGRAVKRFKATTGPVQASVVLAANRPSVRGEQRTTLHLEGEVWQAAFEFRLRVEGGVADAFRLEVPDEFDGPYYIDTGAELEASPASDGRKLLLIRPPVAVGGVHRFTVSGPLTFAPGRRVSVPSAVLRDAQIHPRLLILPTRLQRQPASWETLGLVNTPLPADLATAGSGPVVAYRVDTDSFHAVLRPRAGAAGVELADIGIVCRKDGTCHGVATFDLRAGALSEVVLSLPGGLRLVQVMVAGLPAWPVPVEEGVWRVTLAPGTLPQQLEVLFQGASPSSGTAGTPLLRAPFLEGLPVQRTLWTIAAPPGILPDPALQGEGVGALSLRLARAHQVADLVVAGQGLAEEDPEESRPWYRRWCRRWIDARLAVERQLEIDRAQGETDWVRANLARLDAQVARAVEQLGIEDLLASASRQDSAADSLAQVWLAGLDRSRTVHYFDMQGSNATVRLQERRGADGALATFWLPSLLLVGVTIVVSTGMRRGWLRRWLIRWPHLAGVLVGLVWWLWLWPSVLGLAIVLFSLIASYRYSWPTAPRRGSTIVFVGRD